jgi:hypothetical protein
MSDYDLEEIMALFPKPLDKFAVVFPHLSQVLV